MVKNAKGGNKSKKMGRKFVNAPVNKALRMANPSESCEIYGVVNKLFGHGRFEIVDPEGKTRLVIIPNKFRGRSKRDNTVVLGGWVLVGIREYESGENQKCDLLEVYNDSEKMRLKKTGNPIFLKLKSDHDKSTPDEDDGLEFTFEDNAIDEKEYDDMMATIGNNKKDSGNINIVMGEDDEEVDIDDI